MLKTNETYAKNYTIQAGHTVNDILPEAAEFVNMPDVFTTGCLVAVIEWACIEHLSQVLPDGIISLGVEMNLTHDAPCTTGTAIEIRCTVQAATSRSVTWAVDVFTCRGGVLLGRGTHTRTTVKRAKFSQSVDQAITTIGGQRLQNP